MLGGNAELARKSVVPELDADKFDFLFKMPLQVRNNDLYIQYRWMHQE